MYHFFAMLSRMKFINRWGLMRNTKEESLSQHSFEVATIAHALVIIHNRNFGGALSAERAAVLGLYHDATEIITGDMPTPVKYFSPKIRKAYTEVEEMAQEKLISMLPKDLVPEYKPLIEMSSEADKGLLPFVKAADKLSALIKCVEEQKSGNAEFNQAEKTIAKAVKDLNMPEVDFFVKEFLPSYRLTLDEQE